MSPDSGGPEESRYSIPLMDWQGNMQLIKARGVDYTICVQERKVPSEAAALFPEMEGRASKAHQGRHGRCDHRQRQQQMAAAEGL
jgi:hypothetical protein